jgi:peptidoglycan-associated lipoprotein
MRQNEHPRPGRIGLTLNSCCRPQLPRLARPPALDANSLQTRLGIAQPFHVIAENLMHIVAIVFVAMSVLAGCSSQPFTGQTAASVEDRNPEAVIVSEVRPIIITGASESIDQRLKDPGSPLSKRTIYFDLDSFIVKDEHKILLGHHARFLDSNGKYKMLIQGNTDERGTREYNLALGQKRSEAIKKVLKLLGAREDQLEAVSLGEERSACSKSSEDCWAKNRRGDMLYSGEF